MSPTVKTVGVTSILLALFMAFTVPAAVWVGNQASHVPELQVEIVHLSKGINKLVTSIEGFERSNNARHAKASEILDSYGVSITALTYENLAQAKELEECADDIEAFYRNQPKER